MRKIWKIPTYRLSEVSNWIRKFFEEERVGTGFTLWFLNNEMFLIQVGNCCSDNEVPEWWIETTNDQLMIKQQSGGKKNMEKEKTFVTEFMDTAAEVHQNAILHGFWGNRICMSETLILIHSELSEALEGIRKPGPDAIEHKYGLRSTPSVKIPGFSNMEEEMADVIIRVMDMSVHYGLDIAKAILAKMEYNEGREYKHGKEF